jgi:uncharacterized protein YkwD
MNRPKKRRRRNFYEYPFCISLKRHFIPHEGNHYHPHIFHTKRAIFYSGFFVAIKIFVIVYAVTLPVQAYTAPDVLAAQAEKILALTNGVRKNGGTAPLARAEILDRTAGARSSDMAENGYFGHSGPNGHTLGYFMKQTGGRYVETGENLAEGFSTAEDVVAAWTKSPSHYANLIASDFDDFGIGISEGIYEGSPTIFIAEHFGEKVKVKGPDSEVGSREGIGAKPSNGGTPSLSAEAGQRATSTTEGNATSTMIETTGTVLGITSENVGSASPSLSNAGTTRSAPLDRYVFAKSWFSGVVSVFSASRWIYLASLVFFAAALSLSLAIEFRRHHPHAVLKAAGLMALLILLLRF